MRLRSGMKVKWKGVVYEINAISASGEQVQLVGEDGLSNVAPAAEVTPHPFLVTITYFKPSGKYYCEDEDVTWPEDETHFTKWTPFEALVRVRDMFAVCMETPLGYPQFAYPGRQDAIDRVVDRARTIALAGEPSPRQVTCLSCAGTHVATLQPGTAQLRPCPNCKGRGTVDVPESSST